ncbi:MAG TPA: Gfo/Idh/MocA family oxidoreductase [Spirochaetia bacterium]|nr:Gfo/Idh/MocA family oxidoreductase [Spirochaetia bacterium]
MNLAVIGCGGFVRGVHIPNILANERYALRATMDVDPEAAKEVCEKTSADFWTTDYDRILSDPDIDAVLIATRHDSHAELSVRAANFGKHILCEKPMALNAQDVAMIMDAVSKNGVIYSVGYNRGLAPMIQKAKELLKGNAQKKMIYHRIQSLFPEDSWTHDPRVGGGRFIGEGCHIFDLMAEIVGAPPVSVAAFGGTFLDPAKVKIPDSATVVIVFADGSVATTLINSAGCDSFEKEATEIYCDRKAIYINNFQEMKYYGFEGHKVASWALDSVDKGHRKELELFAAAILDGGECPNGLVNAARAAVISYKVIESIQQNGAVIPIKPEEYGAGRSTLKQGVSR